MLARLFHEIRRSIGARRPPGAIRTPAGSFVEQDFAQIEGRLGIRMLTFRRILQYVETIAPPYYIVETGTTRAPGHWEGDGNSTIIWDRFVGFWGGRVRSVDISPEYVDTARQHVSDRTEVVCSDSVKFLSALVDLDRAHLVYLDSYDLDRENSHPSALHHLMELAAVFGRLRPGALVVVDDCITEKLGKHIYVQQFFDSIGVAPLFRGYQTGWVIPARPSPSSTELPHRICSQASS